MSTKPVSIIIPTYSEKDNIVSFIKSIVKKFNPREIIVVDDNSPDSTYQLMRRQFNNQKRIRLILNPVRIGLTKSIQKGIDAAKNKYICFMDADFSHPPEILNNLFDTLVNCDIVIASRFIDGGGDLRTNNLTKYMSLIANKCCQFAFSKKTFSYTSGCAMAGREIFNKHNFRGNHGEFFMDFVVRNDRKGYKIKEVPYIYLSRKRGHSKTAASIRIYLINCVRYFLMFSLLYSEITRGII